MISQLVHILLSRRFVRSISFPGSTNQMIQNYLGGRLLYSVDQKTLFRHSKSKVQTLFSSVDNIKTL